jgi:Family of unknown function (DUF6049)
MARRAGSALAAALAVSAMVLPAALLATLGPTAAAAAQPVTSQVSVNITGMSPQWASAGSTITVTGSLTNLSEQQISGLTVQLLGSSTPVGSLDELQQQSPTQVASLANVSLPAASWRSTGQLAPQASVAWSIRVKASVIGMTTFGVYPLAAQAQGALGSVLASDTTYLPYMPAKKGSYSYSRPSPQQIAWVWPLIDVPLLNQPWQNNCQGAQAKALAQSLASGGRLAELVGVGDTAAGTTEAFASQASHGHGSRSGAARAHHPQSLASLDAITWAIDPALLANARALTTCSSAQPQWAKAASAWLAELRSATSGQPLFVTPYADPDVTALFGQGQEIDVSRSFQRGRAIASQILHRNVTPSAGKGTAAARSGVAGIAWPADGAAGYTTLENLAATDAVSTLLLDSSALPAAQATVMRALDGAGSYANVVLASASLTQLLDSATSVPGSAFGTSQQFLAETAIMAQQDPSQPIVAAPPQRWQPPTGLGADLLADTASAPWLRPTSLTSLTGAKSIPVVQLPSDGAGHSPFGRKELAGLRALDRQISELEALKARPDPDLYLAVSTIESSAWNGKSKSTAQAMLTALTNRVAAEPHAIQIIAENRITLGGLKGSVPVSIDNRLGYAVQVRLQLQFGQSAGTKITQSPAGLVTIQPHTDQPIRLHVQATQVGSTTITMRLVNRYFQALPSQRRMTVQATQVGVLGMIILAAALGVFLIASAARAVRRGRPAPPTDQSTDAGPADGHIDEGSAEQAGPDTVMAERTELGTAGTPGP